MAKIREYEGDGITVRYDARRCIHAAECVKGLRAVFDPDRRPWIDAGAADPDQIARVVSRCPSGALEFHRADGSPQETPPAPDTVRVSPDGPLYVSGSISMEDHQGRPVFTGVRVALCRCGASANKPFCDNSHVEIGFTD